MPSRYFRSPSCRSRISGFIPAIEQICGIITSVSGATAILAVQRPSRKATVLTSKEGYGHRGKNPPERSQTRNQGTDGTFSDILSVMARLARIAVVNIPHHVTQRGN